MDAEALVKAMLLGDIHSLSEPSHFLFALTGLSHLLCVAGLHLGMSALFANFLIRACFYLLLHCQQKILFRILPWQKWIEYIGTILFMAHFAQITGWGKPVVRAFAAANFTFLAGAMGLKKQRLQILLYSLAASLFLGVGGLLSFALSASAVTGFYILNLTPYFRTRWQKAIGTVIAPWLFTAPLIVAYFAISSLTCPLANFIFIPLACFLIMIPGFCSLFLQILHLSYLQTFFWKIAIAGAKIFLLLLEPVANIPYSAFWVSPPLCWLIFISLCILFFLINYIRKSAFIPSSKFILIASLLLTNICIVLLLREKFLNFSNAAVLDIGQGDAILLKNKNEDPFLVDVGPHSLPPYSAKVNTRVEHWGINKISGILITHPDFDHRGGLESLLLRHIVNAIWIQEAQLNFPATFKIIKIAERANIPIHFLKSNANLYKNLECKTLDAGEITTTNSSCPLCKFTLPSGKTLLLTGDMDKKTELKFLQYFSSFLKTDYLKIAHHGSKYSSGDEFLTATQANTALISVGIHNPYHHPNFETLERLKNHHFNIIMTKDSGTISLD